MLTSSIVAHDLAVRRGGRQILRGLDFEVPTGCIYGLLGPSGCGKSTLMRALVGVQRYTGRLEVLGKPAGVAGLRGRIGYVSQAPSVYADLSVRENLRYFAAMVGAESTQLRGMLDAVGLNAQAGQLVGELSGGQRTRVSLAAALLGNPVLLVLDEPTVGLDPVLRRELWTMFAHLAAEGTTLFISSHVMDEARRCARLLLLREGRVLVAGASPQELLADTGTDDVEAAFLRLVERAEDGVAA